MIRSLWQFRLALKNIRRFIKLALRYAPFTVRPEQIQIDITDRCNYRCPICTKWLQTSAEHELTAEHWRSFLTCAAKLPFSRRIVFAGGEPLLRPDLPELVSHASVLKLNSVVVSNGSVLTEAILKELQEAGLNYLMISLNALEPALHDSTRGVNDSFDYLMRVIETYTVIRKTMSMGIATVITQRNIEHILPLVDFVTERRLHGIMFQTYMDDAVHHPFRGDYQKFRNTDWYASNPDVVRDYHRVDAVIDALLLRQRQGAQILNAPSQLRAMKAFYRHPASYHAISCLAGITSFLVDAYGDVRLCFGFGPVGNILEQEPADIWKSPGAVDLRKRVARCRRSCRLMNHIY